MISSNNNSRFNRHHPDFVLDVEIPPGFTDITTEDDKTPVWIDPARQLALYIDYPTLKQARLLSPATRHMPYQRFYLAECYENGDYYNMLVATHRYQDILEELVHEAQAFTSFSESAVFDHDLGGLLSRGDLIEKAGFHFLGSDELIIETVDNHYEVLLPGTTALQFEDLALAQRTLWNKLARGEMYRQMCTEEPLRAHHREAAPGF